MIWPEVKNHFSTRFGEWVGGFGLLLWGLLCLSNEAIFKTVPVFISMAEDAPYYVWGGLAASVGILRIVFLIINGTWKRSAHLRAIGAGLSALVLATVFFGYAGSEYPPPSLGLIFPLLALDLKSLWSAAGEAKHSDLEHYDSSKNKEILI
jgi:heme exporter protein D